MPLFYKDTINDTTKLGIWKIEENERFFLKTIPLQREITHPLKRLQHLSGRYLLPVLFDDFPYNEILIANTRKPYLPDEQYHFSISHCGNFAAAIASKNERVGIDIELAHKRILNISGKFLNKKEQQIINESKIKNPAFYIQHLTLIWAAKEAIFKWWNFENVDFKKNIYINNFVPDSTSRIAAIFSKDHKQYDLSVRYKMFEDLCLVWLNN